MKKYPLPDKYLAAEAVILADGEYPDHAGSIAAEILRGAQRVVCCDGAADSFIARGGSPAAIVGDCDSISERNRRLYAAILHCNPDQESNDLTKAFDFCVASGMRDIVILGATGRREDHTIGNISLLCDYAARADVCMVTQTGVFNAIAEPSEFESFAGQQVSIFTLATDTKLRTEGLLYTPPPGGLKSWWRGTLNESAGDNFTIFASEQTIVFRELKPDYSQLGIVTK